MTLPRRLLPRQTHSVTRRTQGRRAFLKPDPWVNQVVLYSLGLAQLRFPGVSLHAFITEVTHHHANLTDAPGESLLSRFFELLHSYVARALNSHFGRGENLWRQPDSFDNSEIHDVETLEEQLLYLWTQPLKDGLVANPADWTGVAFWPEDFGRTITMRKPEGRVPPRLWQQT